jgi:carotenoid cleavage dioxygenase-like enzyme
VRLAKGKAYWRSRFVHTEEYEMEKKAGKMLFSGMMGSNPKTQSWMEWGTDWARRLWAGVYRYLRFCAM